MLLTWTIIGSVNGLLLASYIFSSASPSRALAPNPYTVSVGKATSFPDLMRSAAKAAYYVLRIFAVIGGRGIDLKGAIRSW